MASSLFSVACDLVSQAGLARDNGKSSRTHPGQPASISDEVFRSADGTVDKNVNFSINCLFSLS